MDQSLLESSSRHDAAAHHDQHRLLVLLCRRVHSRVLHLTAWVVGIFMATTLAILIRCGYYLWENPQILELWWREANVRSASATEGIVILLLLIFPQLALGISGFELSMTVVPL